MTLFTAKNIAIVCPTKNQPIKVVRLLTSIAALHEKPQQIIVADGGHNLKPVIAPFKKNLKITCLYCPEIGQVLQRNHAHKYLKQQIKIVIHLDDDATLDANAITEMLAFWNRESGNRDKPIGGVSFNVQDLLKTKSSFLRKLFFLHTEPAGNVSKAGYAAPYMPTKESLSTSWLVGGATAWSRDVIDGVPHPINFPTKWAVCEDLMFSYPLRNDYRLMVAVQAISYHNETYNEMSFQRGRFYGLSSAIMRYHFVRLNPELKTWAYIWMTLGIIVGNLIRGLLGSRRHIGLCFGGTKGIIRAMVCSFLNGYSCSLAKSLVHEEQTSQPHRISTIRRSVG
jgi:glycosyltransferase involved in cell wall biosynthesis